MKLTQNDITPEQTDRLLLYIFLGRIHFLTFQEKLFFLNNIDSVHTLALLSIEEIEKQLDKKFNKKLLWDGNKNLLHSKKILELCRRMDIQPLLYEEENFPSLLKEINDPPIILFCRGNVSLLSGSCTAMVGTRKITQEGKEAAVSFAYDCVISGCNVVSGLASGVDAFSHQGAINAWFDCKAQNIDLSKVGRTIAVLPCSIDEIVPCINKKLAANILQTGGLIVSEYEPGVETKKWQFVARNRIIAALSSAVLVVQAPSGSGALLTAEFALDYNRELFIHKAAFSQSAKQVASIVKSELEVKHAVGQVSRHKLENTVEKFIEAGAPVIENFKEYCELLGQNPESRLSSIQKEIKQGNLFEDIL